MDISIIAAGSRGDVQPYLALSVGFQAVGHKVRFLAPSDYKELAAEHKVDYFDLGGNMQAVAQGLEAQLEQGNMLKIMLEMRHAAAELVGEATERSVEASRGADLVLGGLGALSIAITTADALDIPYVPAFLYPFTPTTEFANLLSPVQGKWLPGWAKKATFYLAQQLMWQAGRAADNRARSKLDGVDNASFWGPFRQFEKSRLPILYGYSKHVIPIPIDWDESNFVTGFWHLDPPDDWQPTAALREFLESGQPPIYIGFGSMINRDPADTRDMIISALRRSGQRGVVGAGWSRLESEDLPEFIHLVGSVPHSWLFPRMAAVVHHGGVGTTAAGLRAGVPSIITPFFGDQPYWGSRIFELGVGPKPIPKKRLNSDKLGEAIQLAVGDDNMKQKAADVGSLIQRENGIEAAISSVERAFTAGQ